jgi:hypothetical protein
MNFYVIMCSYEAKNIENLKQLVWTAVSNVRLLMFYEKLVSWDIHIKVLIGQSYNRYN